MPPVRDVDARSWVGVGLVVEGKISEDLEAGEGMEDVEPFLLNKDARYPSLCASLACSADIENPDPPFKLFRLLLFGLE